MNRTLVLLAVGSSALALAGCGPDFFLKPPKHAKSVFAVRTISKLECPDEKGDLKLVSAAADGKSCAYKDGDTEVTLKLVSLNGGDAATALSPIEVELKSLMPAETEEPAKVKGDHGSRDEANIDLPGVHIRADDHGARIRAPGVDINAADESGSNTTSHRVTVTGDGEGRGAHVEIDADEDGANVSTDRRTRHTRHFGRMDGILAKFVMTAHTPLEGGYRIVGYEAHGPKDGPMAVAVVKSKKADVDEEDVFSDAKALVRLNVGPGSSHIVID